MAMTRNTERRKECQRGTNEADEEAEKIGDMEQKKTVTENESEAWSLARSSAVFSGFKRSCNHGQNDEAPDRSLPESQIVLCGLDRRRSGRNLRWSRLWRWQGRSGRTLWSETDRG
jgi:hypothetical protein